MSLPHPEQSQVELPEGMIDFQARCAIQDLVSVYGFEEARMLVAMYLTDTQDRRPRNASLSGH